jgi:Tfp pilus assembly protein PilF
MLLELWKELHRRRVFGALIGYSVIVWVLLQIASVIYQPLGAPPWAMTWTVLIAALGFPIAAVLAWSFDLTRDGIVRTHSLPGSGSRLRQLAPLLVVLVVVSALGYGLWGVYSPRAGGEGRVVATERALEGRQWWSQRTPESLAKAKAAFEQAIAADPQFAAGYTGLADTLLLTVDYDQGSLLDAVKQAEPLIHKAMELDPQSSEAFASFGLLKRSVRQASGAESMFRQALKLDPNNVTALIWLGGLYGNQGRLTEQREMLERAHQLDQFNALAAINRADNRAQTGAVDEAREILNAALKVDADNALVLRALAATELSDGRFEPALKISRQLLMAHPSEANNGALMLQVLMALGAFDTAEQVLEIGLRAVRMSPESDRGARQVKALLAYAARGERPARENLVGPIDQREDFGLTIPVLLLANAPEQAEQRLKMALEGDLDPVARDIELLLWGAEVARRLDQSATRSERLQHAQALLARARAQGAQSAWFETLDAMLLAMQGEMAQALARIQSVYATRDVHLAWLDVDLRLSTLREYPPFIEWAAQARARTEALRARLDTSGPLPPMPASAQSK